MALKPALARGLVALGLLLAALAPAGTALAADCDFKLGFKVVADQIPDLVGPCLENEHFNLANGNSEQRTTAHHGKGGLLVWRKADNWTAFTDGYWTWVNGPRGLQRRLNTETFDWEAPPPPVAAPPAGQAAPPAPVPAPTQPAASPAAATPRVCSVTVPGWRFAAVFQGSGNVRPLCDDWSRALADRLRRANSETDWCARIRLKNGMTDDLCRSLKSLASAPIAVADQGAAGGSLLCFAAIGDARVAVLDVDQQQIGGLFCTVLEDSSVKVIRS